MAPPPPPAALPPGHPLAAELAALRQQIAQYRAAAHQAQIDVQGARLELELAREDAAGLRAANTALSGEVATLRATPEPPVAPPPSNALAELSLAHRRLSAKLDFTEQQLSSVTLELASTKQELLRAQKERDSERAHLVELRRVEEDREEEVAWERGERRRIEEQRKLVDLALDEYAALVRRLDPTAVPPPLPRRTTDNILQTPPVLPKSEEETKANGTPKKSGSVKKKKAKEGEEDKDKDMVDMLGDDGDAAPLDPEIAASADAISNLLVGQRGVQRLFRDFTSAITTKEKQIHALQTQKDELEQSIETLRTQLDAETRTRVEAQSERDRVLRDDASAAKVVERYMTFSQKAHETVHSHLAQQRTRAAATQNTLRAESAALRRRNRHEGERSARLRAAAEEMAEELGRESAGRRREVALRLGLIAEEEARCRRAEAWLDRVRRARERPDGARDEPDYTALVDEAVEILAPSEPKADLKPVGGFRTRFLRRKTPSVSTSPSPVPNPQEESLARVFLAEELVQHLVLDLQAETERRVELEKQRVAWLAKEAADGVPAATASPGEDVGTLFDVENEDDKKSAPTEVDNETKVDSDKELPEEPSERSSEPERLKSASPPPPPVLDDLTALFQPLQAQYLPLQQSLHAQALSLKALRSSIPEPAAASPLAPAGSRRAGALRVLSIFPTRTAYEDLATLLDSLHEVIEDARVDVEIAMADEDRQFHGFAALLGVGASGVVQAPAVLRDASAYIATRTGPETLHARLETRVADIENDLASIKRTLHELEGMETAHEEEVAAAGTAGKKPAKKRSPFATLPLRTVSPLPLTPRSASPATSRSTTPSALATALAGDDSDEDLSPRTPSTGAFGLPRPGILGNVGRTISTGMVGAASGVVGAPRRMGEFAGGLYRPRAKSFGRKDSKDKEHEVKEGLLERDGEIE